MALKNQAITVCYVAWNTSTNAGQTGDSGNHTLKLVQDGTEGAPTNAPTQVDATNCAGVYQIALVAADMNFNCVVLCGKSSTANVVIIPVIIVTERGVLPTVAPATSGGFLTVGTGTGQLNPTSGGVDLQTIKTQAITCSAGVTISPFVGNATAALAVDASGRVILQPTQAGVTIPTVTTVTNQLTAAQVATGVWQDTTAGDFTVASSIGKSLYTSGNAPGASGGYQINGTNAGTVTYAAMTITGAFTWTGGVTGSITGNLSGSVGSVTGNVGGNVVGSVASVTAAVTISTAQLMGTPRALDTISDNAVTINDVLWAGYAAGVGQRNASSGTSMTVGTAHTGTILRTYTLTTVAGTPSTYVTEAL